jgi:WD40 repeat protein
VTHVSVYRHISTEDGRGRLTQRKTPPLTYPSDHPVHFKCVDFSSDSKLLVAVADDPDLTIVVWHWEKDKISHQCQLLNMSKEKVDVTRVCFPPNDKTCVTTSGHMSLKMWSLNPDGGVSQKNLLPPNKVSQS